MDITLAKWRWTLLLLCGFFINSPADAADDAGIIAARIVKEAKTLRESGQKNVADKYLREAVKNCEDQIKQQPDDAQSHFALAQLQMQLNEVETAEVHLKRAVQLEPNNAAMHALKGRFHSDAKEYSEAIKALRRSLELDPKQKAARVDLCICLRYQDETEEALSQAREVLRLAPDDSGAVMFFAGFQASILFDAGKYDEWERIVRSAMNTHPQHKKVLHQFLVSGFASQQRYEKAYRESLELQKLDPEDPVVEGQLIVLATQARQPTLAATHIDRLREFHRAGKFRDSSFARDEFSVGRKHVIAGEYFDLKDAGIRFSFGVSDDVNEKYYVSLRNWPEVDAGLVEEGHFKESDKAFLLLKTQNGKHEIMKVFRAEPTYERLRTVVVEVIEGTRQPLQLDREAAEVGPGATAVKPANENRDP
ncbi:tetratricopeptide repeat protein [Anatilimnocola floriformis]|uniref:tetratricopeptide repeat protein n=1 Tax=Anatilimnocola floriformis TaxID=2948575 RepID=UPI0020C1C68E|nr:tetratricopeptide repeat protein [Anatilimnocola floriformis]